LDPWACGASYVHQSSVPPFGSLVAQKYNIVSHIRLDASLVGLVSSQKSFEFFSGNWFGKVIASAMGVTALGKSKQKNSVSVEDNE
jgi:hypothetical protein